MDAYTARLLGLAGMKREQPLWYTGIHQIGAESNGPALENAMALAVSGAQGTPDANSMTSPEALVAEGIPTDSVDPASQEFEFVGNMLCCPQCAAMNGTRASGMRVATLPHPNCRCAWVPVAEAGMMRRNNMQLMPQGKSLQWVISQIKDEDSNYNNMMAGRNSVSSVG